MNEVKTNEVETKVKPLENRVLTDHDLNAISEVIRGHCPMKEEEIETLKAITSVIKELGQGDLYQGSLTFRRQSEFVGRILSRKNIVIGLILVASVGAVATNAVDMMISWIASNMENIK